MDDVRRLAADLGRFLDELPVEVKASRASSAERHGRNAAQARAVRRERLERYVDAMTPAQRLRLAGALHLLPPPRQGSRTPRPAGGVSRNRRIFLTAADLADIKRIVPNGAAGARYREVSLPIWT